MLFWVFFLFIDIAKRLDLVFALDGSKNVQSNAFSEIKRFVRGTIGAYRIAANETRVGLITFGGATVSNLKLSEGIYKSTVEQGIFDIMPVGGDRNLNSAVTFADKYIFEESKADGIAKVLVLIVDGFSFAKIPDSAAKIALDDLRSKNVTILIVAIGKEADEQELKDLAKDDKLIKVPNVVDIKQALTDVVEESSKATGEDKYFSCTFYLYMAPTIVM